MPVNWSLYITRRQYHYYSIITDNWDVALSYVVLTQCGKTVFGRLNPMGTGQQTYTSQELLHLVSQQSSSARVESLQRWLCAQELLHSDV